MSDEQLDAHGLPRREFLKRAAIGAGVFAVPVVVSFGLGGTAEARSCFPNQTVANQYNEAHQLGHLALDVFDDERSNRIETGFAQDLRKRLLKAEENVLNSDWGSACKGLQTSLSALSRWRGKKIDDKTADTYYNDIQQLMNLMDCDSCL